MEGSDEAADVKTKKNKRTERKGDGRSNSNCLSLLFYMYRCISFVYRKLPARSRPLGWPSLTCTTTSCPQADTAPKRVPAALGPLFYPCCVAAAAASRVPSLTRPKQNP